MVVYLSAYHCFINFGYACEAANWPVIFLSVLFLSFKDKGGLTYFERLWELAKETLINLVNGYASCLAAFFRNIGAMLS